MKKSTNRMQSAVIATMFLLSVIAGGCNLDGSPTGDPVDETTRALTSPTTGVKHIRSISFAWDDDDIAVAQQNDNPGGTECLPGSWRESTTYGNKCVGNTCCNEWTTRYECKEGKMSAVSLTGRDCTTVITFPSLSLNE